MQRRQPHWTLLFSLIYMSEQWEEPGWNAPGSISTDSLSVFKWPVITTGEQIKIDFRWGFNGWNHLLHAYTEIIITKNTLKNTHPAISQINKELTKACSSLIIDVLAKLTRQARNPGYNLWDKYFIANICLYILCQCVLKLLQMNVKREVSEQAVMGTEQRCSSAVRRKEDSQEERTRQQTIFPGSSNKLNMQCCGLHRIALVQRKTK